MKKQILLLAMMLSMAASAFAVEVEIDGIWYDVIKKAKEAKVIQNKNHIEYSGDIVIPETINYEGTDCSVTSIENYAFYSCSGLTSITIPNSVTSIGESAFEVCSSLTTVHISDLEAWCKINFTGSYSNPLSYAHHLFLNGEEIKDLMIPNSVTSIGYSAFSGCSGLTSVTIGNNVTSIGEQAFSSCTGLTSVTIGNSVTSIGKKAFYWCTGLTSVTIGNNVTSIEESAFYYCTGLTSVTIPNSVTSIGNSAFCDCTGLTSVTIPNSVTSIGGSAFQYCI